MKSVYDVLTPSNYIQKGGIGWAWWAESLDITGFLDSATKTIRNKRIGHQNRSATRYQILPVAGRVYRVAGGSDRSGIDHERIPTSHGLGQLRERTP